MTAFTLPASYKTGTATVKGPQSATVTITIASPAVVSWTAHGLSAGDTFVPTTTGALPTGLVAGTTYYVIAAGLTANAFEVAATAGGAAINTTGTQSGTHTGSSTSFTVTGIGTAWASTIQVGDTFEGNDSRSVEVASVIDDTHLVLDHAWRGTSQTAAYYRIVYAPDANRQLVKTRQMIEALKIPQTGMPMVFDGTGTTDIYPGQGKVRANDPANPTVLYIAKTDSLGNDISGREAVLDDSINAVSRAALSFRPTDGANAFMDFDVTGAITDGGLYVKVPVALRSGVVPANLATLAMAGVPSGASGASGTNGTFTAVEVIKTADYTMLAADTGKTIIFNSAGAINGFFSAVATLGSTWMVLVKNIGAGVLTLDPNGSETIDGATTLALAQNQSAIVSCNGSLLRTEAFSPGTYTSVNKSGDTMTGDLTFSGGKGIQAAAYLNGGTIGNIGRNIMLNGNFDVWQRGTTSSASTGSGGYFYLPDRWSVQRFGTASVTVSRQLHGPADFAGCPTYFYRYAHTVAGTGGTFENFCMQSVEGVVRGTAGGTYTLTFWGKSDATRNIFPTLTQNFGTGGSPSTQVTNGVGAVVLTTSWQKFSYAITLASVAAKTFGTNNDDLINLQFSCDPSLPNTVQTNDLSHISVTPGDCTKEVDPYGVPVPFAMELSRCQRYYEKSFAYATAPAQNAGFLGAELVSMPTGGAGPFGVKPSFKATKRTAPTITTFNPGAANANWRDFTNSADRTVTVSNTTDSGFDITGASAVASSLNFIHWTAEADF